MPSYYSLQGIHFTVPDGWVVSEDDLNETVRGITLGPPTHGACMVDLYRAEQAPPLDKYIQKQVRQFAEALPVGFKVVDGPHSSIEKARHQGGEVLGTTVKLVIRSWWLTRSHSIDSYFRLELGSQIAMCSLRSDQEDVSTLRPAFEEFLESIHA